MLKETAGLVASAVPSGSHVSSQCERVNSFFFTDTFYHCKLQRPGFIYNYTLQIDKSIDSLSVRVLLSDMATKRGHHIIIIAIITASWNVTTVRHERGADTRWHSSSGNIFKFPDSSSSSRHRWPLRLKTLFTESECTDGASVNHISHTQLPSCLASDNKSAAPGCVCPFYHAHITPYPERERHFWPA